ncbi:MAG: 2-isopropylmalate synthase [Methanobacteriaceae archaeon]|jgi:D-citramalate synthase|uniref:(R)-citramalate synthase n=1 Tax=unclassified Methanobrevibacter TaxID=2638681 RepID=UPI003759D208|nr:2-isopropylmalate synthase [Methanobacteriaceae archaeon]
MKLKVYDTTLRDGEQTPGISLTPTEKLAIALRLDELGVDIIEAGSAITSKGEREAIQDIAHENLNAEIASFARILKEDVDYCLDCDVSMVNLVVPTSPIHMEYKLKKSPGEVLNQAVNVTEYAKSHGLKILLSAEDSTRSDMNFLKEVFKQTISAGACRICPCDTVSMLTPEKSLNFYKELSSLGVPVDVHCHNDFGLSTANTLAGIRGGASEFHVTVNGIGERAGNASLEEVVVSLNQLYDNYSTNINLNQLYSASKMVSRLTGAYLEPNKAIVGENAFSHESGIHSDGMLKNSHTYEPFNPELVGNHRRFVLGKHVGSKGLQNRLEQLGIYTTNKELSKIFDLVKNLADKGKIVTDADIQAISDYVMDIAEDTKVDLQEVTIVSGNRVTPTASVKLGLENQMILEAGIGVGPVDAAINAVNKGVKEFADVELEEYHVDAITGGADALIDVIVKLRLGNNVISARSTQPDIINASVEAYIIGVNRLLEIKKKQDE